MRAFIETCRLQAELAEELELPEVADLNVVAGLRSRWSCAAALKLVRTHVISPGAPVLHFPELHHLATTMLFMRTSYRRTGIFPSDLGHELTELLEGDPGLEMFAVLAAGLPVVRKDRDWGRGATIQRIHAHTLRSQPAWSCSKT